MTTKAIEFIETFMKFDCLTKPVNCGNLDCNNCIFDSDLNPQIKDKLIKVIKDAKDQSS